MDHSRLTIYIVTLGSLIILVKNYLQKILLIMWHIKVSVASTEQASSADNISGEEMASNMSRPRTHATDLSAINNSTHHINTG